MNRRQLLALSIPACVPAVVRDRLVMHTYVWQQEFSRRNVPLAEGAAEMGEACRAAGFRQMELMPAFLDPDVLPATVRTLERLRLTAPIVYANAELHTAPERGVAQVLQLAERAATAGAAAVNVNPSPKPGRERKLDLELNTQAAALNALGGALAKLRLKLLVHHHDAELVENAREWHHQLQNTDPELVGMCVDVNWAHVGGQHPLQLMAAAGTRVKSLHLRNSRDGAWLECLAEGDVDLEAIAARTPADTYLVVELAYAKGTERTRPLPENLRVSADYARRLFGI